MPKPTVKRPGRTQRISERLSSESDSRPSSSSTPQPTKVEKKQTRDDGDSNLRVLLLNDRLVTQKEMFCPLCDVLKPNGEEIFRTREAFAIHFRKYHADVELILSCGVCDQSFGTAKQLAEHLDLHDANGDVPQEISIDSDVDSDVEVIDSAKKTMKKSPKFSQYPSMEKS